MKKIKSDNFGFSLVEIIITVAIISVVAGIAGYGLSLSNGKPAEQCARELASVLSQARTTTMGKYGNEITITNTGDGYKVVENITISVGDDGKADNTDERESNIGGKGVTIKYSTDGGGTDKELESGKSIKLQFDSGSGALKSVSPLSSDKDLTELKFIVSKANTTMYVTVSKLTGKVSVSNS